MFLSVIMKGSAGKKNPVSKDFQPFNLKVIIVVIQCKERFFFKFSS